MLRRERGAFVAPVLRSTGSTRSKAAAEAGGCFLRVGSGADGCGGHELEFNEFDAGSYAGTGFGAAPRTTLNTWFEGPI